LKQIKSLMSKWKKESEIIIPTNCFSNTNIFHKKVQAQFPCQKFCRTVYWRPL
jgi:hypothetical protein